MKTSIFKNNVKRIVSIFLFSVLAAACGNADNIPQVTGPEKSRNQSVTGSEECRHLQTIIQNEVKGKTSEDPTVLLVAAKNASEAFKQAQELAIKLNAKLIEKKDAVSIYSLPDGKGKIEIREKKDDDCVYVILYLHVSCDNPIQIKEIRYMRLRCYQNL
jgi:hypothetical protein